jgi:hypothetical protein
MVDGTMDTDGIVNTLSITLAPALSCGRGHFYFCKGSGCLVAMKRMPRLFLIGGWLLARARARVLHST